MSELKEPALLRLCLYTAGDSRNSVMAERNLRRLLSSYPEISADLEIRDVLVDPDSGLAANVFATPTLVKLGPGREARLMGDLRDLDMVRSVLGLRDVETAKPEPQSR